MSDCSSSGEVFRILTAGDDLPARLADHAPNCADCRTAMRRAERFESELQGGAAQLAAREMPNLNAGGATEPRGRSFGWLPALTTVAVAMVAAFILVAGYDRLGDAGRMEPNVSQPAVASQSPDEPDCPSSYEGAQSEFDTRDAHAFVATATVIRFVDSPDPEARGYDVAVARYGGPLLVDRVVLVRVDDPIPGIGGGQAVLVLGQRTDQPNLILPGECVPLQPIEGSPQPSPSAAVFLPPQGTSVLAESIPVYAEPEAPEPFTVLEGQNIYVRGHDESPDGADWQEVQLPYGVDWVFGWIPLDAPGVPPLEPFAEPPCPTPEEFAAGLLPDTPARPACMRDGLWSIGGYLIRADQPGTAYEGEPAWLVGPPEYALTGAIGPAVTGWQLPLHFDPALGVEVDADWLSDREGPAGPRVTVSVRVRHEASDSCALTARDPDLADPMPLQAVDWCQQRVVVTSMQPGPSDAP
ncbi:MAG: hypothetical protein M3406_14670 [Chloroflexota bacterium]|nr:hypothetical protein [Chloroflexota bacterium]